MSATPNAPGAVRVKSLEWCENPDHSEGGWLGGGITNSTYHAMDDGWCFHRSRFWKVTPTLEAAKAAAQADYTARILSALEPTPDAIRAAALEEAAKVADYHAAPLHAKAAKCRKRGDEMGEAVFDSAISEASSIAAAIRALIEKGPTT